MKLRLASERIFIRTEAARMSHTCELDMDQALQLCTELLTMCQAINDNGSSSQSLGGLIASLNATKKETSP